MSVGGVVYVAAGTYSESKGGWRDLEVFKSLSLIGAGSGLTVVELTNLQHGLEVRGTSATILIQGFTLTKMAANPYSSGWAVIVEDLGSSFNSVTFRDLDVGYASGRNLYLGNNSYSSIVMEDCNIHHSGAWGMSVRGNVLSLTIENSDFEYNGTSDAAHGIGLDFDMPTVTNAQVIGGSFSHNTAKGINIVKTTNATFTGITANNNGGAPGGGFGVSLWEWHSSSSNLSFTNCTLNNNSLDGFLFGTKGTCNIDNVQITGNKIYNNGRMGVFYYDAFGGTLSNFTVSGNKFAGNAQNASDPTLHIYDSNCWMDFPSNPGYPTQYNIGGGGSNADLNPNANDCGDVDVFGPDYVGCPTSGCPGDMLYYTLDQDAMVAGRMWLTLSAGLEADWASDPYVFSPGAGWDPNFQMGWAQKLLDNKVEINIFFGALGGGGSTGNPALYIAAIPVKSVTGAACSQAVAGDSAYFFEGPGDPPVRRDLFLATKLITVDCAAPTGTLAYEPSAPACNAFGDESQLVGKFKAEVFRGATDCNAPLDEVWLTVNGHTYTFFGTNPTGDFSQVFPGSGTLSETDLWSWLNEGCNDLVLHFKDTECNESSITLSNVGKDVTIPNLTVDFVQSGFYNDESASPQYGASLLGGDLNIDSDVGTNDCSAQTGILWFSYLGDSAGTPYADLAVTDYPAAGSVLWAWMVGKVGAGASGDYIFTVHAKDCAGNETTDDFEVCIDLVMPTNSFTEFDARPTGMGVWLKWTWDATNLVEARIFRSPYNAAEYPTYTIPVWNNFGDDGNYEQNYYDAASNWLLVATLRDTNLTSLAFNQGTGLHGGPGNSYWLYKDASWDVSGVDNEERDIYRFVTFVKDAAGNWSELTAYTQNTDADRSTNYWLGDFSMDLDDDPVGPTSFAVQGVDLSLFSGAYFKKVPTDAHPRYDIGPETGFPGGENGVGKGIPMPDDTVNFWDLVPFSFNFYTTGPNTWATPSQPTSPKLELNVDEQPVVMIRRLDDAEIAFGDEFSIVLSLAGNETNVVKGVEAVLEFDPSATEFVSAATGDLSVLDGQIFTVARPIEGSENTIGVAAAACGPIAVLNGDADLSVITFRWKSETSAHATFDLPSVRMYDAHGTILSGNGATLEIGADGLAPLEFALYQNYPNPFNPSTTIRFDLREIVDVRIVIHNVLGQEVRTLVSTHMEAGQYRVFWDGRDNSGAPISSGLYFCRMTAGDFQANRKMFVTR